MNICYTAIVNGRNERAVKMKYGLALWKFFLSHDLDDYLLTLELYLLQLPEKLFSAKQLFETNQTGKGHHELEQLINGLNTLATDLDCNPSLKFSTDLETGLRIIYILSYGVTSIHWNPPIEGHLSDALRHLANLCLKIGENVTNVGLQESFIFKLLASGDWIYTACRDIVYLSCVKNWQHVRHFQAIQNPKNQSELCVLTQLYHESRLKIETDKAMLNAVNLFFPDDLLNLELAND